MCDVTLRRVLVTIVAAENNQYECVCVCVALFIQHAMHMRHIVIVACPALLKYFSTLSHKRHD